MATYSLDVPSPYSLSIPSGDHLGESIARKRVAYELPAMQALTALLPPSPSIVDIGANVGNHTIFWAVSGANVYAYEPNPLAFTWLQRNIDDNGLQSLVQAYPCAVGASVGRSRIAASPPDNLGATVVEPEDGGEIAMVTLDSQELSTVDAIKIDVEGHELDVLRGASKTLSIHRPILMVEVWSGSHRDAIDAELREYGYCRMANPVAGAPSYLYLPTRRALLSAYCTPAVLSAVGMITAGRAKGRIVRSFGRLTSRHRDRSRPRTKRH